MIVLIEGRMSKGKTLLASLIAENYSLVFINKYYDGECLDNYYIIEKMSRLNSSDHYGCCFIIDECALEFSRVTSVSFDNQLKRVDTFNDLGNNNDVYFLCQDEQKLMPELRAIIDKRVML